MLDELSKEFEEVKAVHKYVILKAKMTQYFADLEEGQVKLPDFMRDDSPEKKADKAIKDLLLLNDGGEKFNRLYEKAWESMADYLV